MDLRGMINDSEEVLHRGRSSSTQAPPIYARVYKGAQNAVRDPKREELASTRPEIAEFVAALASHSTPAVSASKKTAHRENSRAQPTYAANTELDGLTRALGMSIMERLGLLSSAVLNSGVEIEFKLGLIADETSMRHRFPTISEAAVDPAYWRQNKLRFRSNVEVSHFDSLTDAANAVLPTPTDENTFDEAFDVQTESEGKARLRITRDTGSEDIIACIIKRRLFDVYISVPESVYDVKMSVSTETPVEPQRAVRMAGGEQPVNRREKLRQEWRAAAYQVDLTRASSNGSISNEVEIECNAELVGRALLDARAKRPEAIDEYFDVLSSTISAVRYLLRSLD